MELPRLSRQAGALVDGSTVHLAMHEAVVDWDDRSRSVPVLVAGGDPLVGMALMRGHRLTVEVAQGGAVRTARLRSA